MSTVDDFGNTLCLPEASFYGSVNCRIEVIVSGFSGEEQSQLSVGIPQRFSQIAGPDIGLLRLHRTVTVGPASVGV